MSMRWVKVMVPMGDDTDLILGGEKDDRLQSYGVPQQEHGLSRRYGELYTSMGLNGSGAIPHQPPL